MIKTIHAAATIAFVFSLLQHKRPISKWAGTEEFAAPQGNSSNNRDG